MHLSKLEEVLNEDGIVFLTYGGLLTQSLIVGMTEALEKETVTKSLSVKVAHDLLTIFIELSQNVMNYSKSIHESEDSKGLILVGFNKVANEYYILSRNIVTKEDKNKIIPKIEQILPLNKDELRFLYRELRKSGKGLHEKGAGIGFIEVARKSERIEYLFTKVDNNAYYFTLKIIIKNR